MPNAQNVELQLVALAMALYYKKHVTRGQLQNGRNSRIMDVYNRNVQASLTSARRSLKTQEPYF